MEGMKAAPLNPDASVVMHVQPVHDAPPDELLPGPPPTVCPPQAAPPTPSARKKVHGRMANRIMTPRGPAR